MFLIMTYRCGLRSESEIQNRIVGDDKLPKSSNITIYGIKQIYQMLEKIKKILVKE